MSVTKSTRSNDDPVKMRHVIVHVNSPSILVILALLEVGLNLIGDSNDELSKW